MSSQKTRIARLYSRATQAKRGVRIVTEDLECAGQWLENVNGEQVSLTDNELQAAAGEGYTIIRILYVDNWRE